MRPRAAAGVAHLGNNFTAFDLFAALDVHLGQMPVAGHQTVAMIDDEIVAQKPLLAGVGHDTVGRGDNGGAFPVGNVEGPVEFPPPGKGGHPIAEAGRDPPVTGSYRGRVGQKVLLLFEFVQQRGEAVRLDHGRGFDLRDLVMHLAQKLVLVRLELGRGIEVFGNRAADTEDIAFAGRLFQIGDHPNLVFEIVQGQNFILEPVDFVGKAFDLFLMMDDFRVPARYGALKFDRKGGGLFQPEIVLDQQSDAGDRRDDGQKAQRQRPFAGRKLPDTRPIAAQQDECNFVPHDRSIG